LGLAKSPLFCPLPVFSRFLGYFEISFVGNDSKKNKEDLQGSA
jgi:hypothetical protein